MSSGKRVFLTASLLLFVSIIFIRAFLGIFVIQPIGAVPSGTTIVYWRQGLDMPFIASADGILAEKGAGVSLMGRGMLLGSLAGPLREREWFRLDYSETLYEWSTGGNIYTK